MKKFLSVLIALCMVFTSVFAFAETTTGTPPEIPTGMDGQTPPEKPEGDMGGFGGQTPPDMQNGGMGPGGETPPEKPDGDGNGFGGQASSDMPGGGMGGGMSGKPESYAAVTTADTDTVLEGETLVSEGTDENALLVTGGNVTLKDCTVTRTSSDSTGGDNASFYGVGAAVLATSGTLTVENTEITTDAAGGAGVFAYGDSVVTVKDCTITTEKGTSGGIHVAGGGTLNAENLTVETSGASSAAIRSDRGGGTMNVNGGSYTANGSGSPAVYVTADISIANAELNATGSEALCLEGLNSVSLTDCNLTGNMKDDAQNDNTWTVILYQSMSGDAEVGKGTFTMTNGTLTSLNGGIFYTTNTESEFTLENVEVIASADSEYFLRCTGNSNQRGWGSTGKNGADCTFTGISQKMNGNVIWDSISNLSLKLTENSVLTGAVVDDESCAGDGGSGTCNVVIDESSVWIVTGDSVVTTLENNGTIQDENGLSVAILDGNGNIIQSGDSPCTIKVLSK